MKKKLPLIALIAATLTVGIYFSVLNASDKVPTLEQGFGIWESEQELEGNPGGYNVATLTIINGNDEDRSFWVSLEQANPTKLPDGYEVFPEEHYDWFTLSGWDGTQVTTEPKVVLKAGEYYQVPIAIRVPYSTTYLDTEAELRVRVTELSGTFQVTALESRWYIVVVETPKD